MRPYNKLYIWVEGVEDQDLFKKVKSLLLKKYKLVHIRERAQAQDKLINNIISANVQKGDENLLAVDSDFDTSPCIRNKKPAVITRFPQLAAKDVLIIVKEIEAWYLAGLSDQACKKIGIKPLVRTDGLNKGQFEKLKPRKFISKEDFRLEILKHFDVKVAEQKNLSFNYFSRHFLQQR